MCIGHLSGLLAPVYRSFQWLIGACVRSLEWLIGACVKSLEWLVYSEDWEEMSGNFAVAVTSGRSSL